MKWALAGTVLLAIVGLGIKWVIDERARNAPAVPTINVQSVWAAYRAAPGHQKHVGEMALDCAACHSQVDGGADRPGPERCASCHEDLAGLHHGLDVEASAEGALSECTACHGFGPEPDQQPGDCLRCHDEPQGELAAVTVHAQDDCLGCHVPHENRVQPRQCAECHQVDVEHGRGKHLETGSEACTTCHDPHAQAEVASDRCNNCHGEKGALPVPSSAGHADQGCAACHANHKFTRDTVSACTSCHTGTHVLPGAGHTRCTSCHDPHALSPSLAAVEQCSGCHRDVKPRHGDMSSAGSGGAGPTECIECHQAHPKSGTKRDTCLNCHALARTETQAHGGELACAQCHTPHEFNRQGAPTCRSCHAARMRELARHPGHADCNGCHQGLPHPAGESPVSCGECHESQQASVHAGHAECVGCHQPHATGKSRFACAGCHEPQASAVGPGHAACGNCHDPHSGQLAPGVSDCSSCHQKQRLPGLHREADHQRCASCHSVHGEQRPATRQRCVSCHEAQQDHQPEADVCSGCHTFRGPGVRRRR